MNALKVLHIEGNSLQGTKEASFVNIPDLNELRIGSAFWFIQKVTLNNARLLEEESRSEMIVRSNKELQNVSHFAGRIVFGSSCFPSYIISVNLTVLPLLRELIVGKGCLKYVKGLKLDGKEFLELVEIGDGCFSKAEGTMEVSDCKKLKSVSIGSNCCVKWNAFVLKNCGVESVEVGDDCFVNCERTVFEDLNELQSLSIGREVFQGSERKKNELVMTSE